MLLTELNDKNNHNKRLNVEYEINECKRGE